MTEKFEKKSVDVQLFTQKVRDEKEISWESNDMKLLLGDKIQESDLMAIIGIESALREGNTSCIVPHWRNILLHTVVPQEKKESFLKQKNDPEVFSHEDASYTIDFQKKYQLLFSLSSPDGIVGSEMKQLAWEILEKREKEAIGKSTYEEIESLQSSMWKKNYVEGNHEAILISIGFIGARLLQEPGNQTIYNLALQKIIYSRDFQHSSLFLSPQLFNFYTGNNKEELIKQYFARKLSLVVKLEDFFDSQIPIPESSVIEGVRLALKNDNYGIFLSHFHTITDNTVRNELIDEWMEMCSQDIDSQGIISIYNLLSRPDRTPDRQEKFNDALAKLAQKNDKDEFIHSVLNARTFTDEIDKDFYDILVKKIQATSTYDGMIDCLNVVMKYKSTNGRFFDDLIREILGVCRIKGGNVLTIGCMILDDFVINNDENKTRLLQTIVQGVIEKQPAILKWLDRAGIENLEKLAPSMGCLNFRQQVDNMTIDLLQEIEKTEQQDVDKVLDISLVKTLLYGLKFYSGADRAKIEQRILSTCISNGAQLELFRLKENFVHIDQNTIREQVKEKAKGDPDVLLWTSDLMSDEDSDVFKMLTVDHLPQTDEGLCSWAKEMLHGHPALFERYVELLGEVLRTDPASFTYYFGFENNRDMRNQLRMFSSEKTFPKEEFSKFLRDTLLPSIILNYEMQNHRRKISSSNELNDAHLNPTLYDGAFKKLSSLLPVSLLLNEPSLGEDKDMYVMYLFALRSIYAQDIPEEKLTEKLLRSEYHRVIEQRESPEIRNIALYQGRNVCYINNNQIWEGNGENRFGKKKSLEAIQRQKPLSFSHNVVSGTLEEMNAQKEALKKKLIETKQPMTIDFDGHGLKDAIVLHGDENTMTTTENTDAVYLTIDDMVEVFEKRKGSDSMGSRDILILESCYGFDFAKSLYKKISDNKNLPIIITMAEVSQLGFMESYEYGSDFRANILGLQTDTQSTIGNVMDNEAEYKETSKSNPCVFVPNDNGYIQISEHTGGNDSTESSLI